MLVRLTLLSFALLLNAANANAHATAVDLPAEYGQYNALLKEISHGKQQPMQGFFHIAKQLESKELEGLTGKKKNQITTTRGYIYRKPNGDLAVERLILDPRFMLDLARRNGTADDTKFFETYNKFTDAEWVEFEHPYMQQSADNADAICIDTSSPFLYDFYSGWLKYLGGYPTEEYIGTLDIYQNYAASMLDMYVFYLVKYPFCDAKKAPADIDNFVDKVKKAQDDNNAKFSKRVISAIKAKRQ